MQRGISLERIAANTKVTTDLWSGLERNDLSRWPAGIYARAYVRAYAVEIGVDPDATVDEFCRLFPNGDRRVEGVVRQQAAMVGHDLQWKDDLVGSVKDERRAAPPRQAPDLPAVAVTRTGRLIAALLDASIIVGVAGTMATLLPLKWSASLAIVGLIYHAASLVILGSSPVVWTIESYLTHRHPTASRNKNPRFLRLLQKTSRP